MKTGGRFEFRPVTAKAAIRTRVGVHSVGVVTVTGSVAALMCVPVPSVPNKTGRERFSNSRGLGLGWPAALAEATG
jgi:hypothetical protein